MEKNIIPDIENEMDELQRLSQDLSRDEGIDISVDDMVNAFNKSKEQTLIDEVWKKLENTESNEIGKDNWKAVFGVAKRYNKTDPNKLKKSIQKGDYKRPLILNLNGRYILVAGNTRLCTASAMGVNPKVFIAKIHNDNEVKQLINIAHSHITRTKGKDYAPDVREIQKWINNHMDVNETELLKGGNSDNKNLVQIAKKHDAKGYYHIINMVQSLKKELDMGVEIEMEHTNNEDEAKEIAMDHLWENPSYYSKLKKSDIEEKRNPHDEDDDKDDIFPTGSSDWRKKETKEQTTASSSGSFEGPVFSNVVLKKDIHKFHNSNLKEQQEEMGEATDASSSGGYDVPLFGSTPKGRKNPLKISGPDSIYKGRAVKDKNFPKWGGPDSVFVKIKDKCKKYPYCNQGDINALEIIKEDVELQNAITETSIKYGIPYNEMEKIVLNQINKIFI